LTVARATTRALGFIGAPARYGTRDTPDRIGATAPTGMPRPAQLFPHAGIVPPKNPPANINPSPNFQSICNASVIDESTACLSSVKQATSHARATEPLGQMIFNLAGFQRLTTPEQLFAVTDLERVARGLPPMQALTAQADSWAQDGANANTDPSPESATVKGGAYWESSGSNWAGGTIDAFASNYFWMYDDGYGSGNIACTSPHASGCWGHRDNILGTYLSSSSGCTSSTELVMGAAVNATSFGGRASYAELFLGLCGPMPPDVIFTWADAQRILGIVPPVVGVASTPDGKGYWLANSAGHVWHFGDARSLGDLSNRPPKTPVVAIVANPVAEGYWLVTAGGAVYGFGASKYHGSMGGAHLNKAIVGMAATRDGGGYWLVASDGGIFSYGTSRFRGSEGGKHLNKPIVGLAADPTTGGYWMVASDGGIFAFDGKYFGSMGGSHLNKPIVGMARTGKGGGYWLVATDGGIFAFGDARFHGSEGGSHLNQPIFGMAADPATAGYWLVATDGGIFAFDAKYYGSAA
jgi:hypothetical protein